ncbi:MAG: autotransporter outer membrane beta-barrel domain-containing protein [Gemmatimonas sp.]|jgi:hypothetical protein|uniref:autotransporter outer membrane beta-barrel domain-containing protein n=1 Tax=Gemmatimonas sp. TaxID=1962908 RepID=UPI00391FB884|nr:autotransporter outer membrane beta-barrel domain-containing protein [Gemmatimonadota bacterium]
MQTTCRLSLLLAAAATLVTSVAAQAQNAPAPTTPTGHKNGLEVDALWPIFPGSLRVHVTRQLWQRGHLRGDAYVGANVDFPRNRDTEGRFADYSVASGYRQYFWRGLHAEFSQTLGMGALDNHVTTGKDYRSFDWLITGYAGYRFNLGRSRYYLIPQVGVANVAYKSNPWPIFEDKTLTREVGEQPFVLGALRFGFSF